MALGINANTSIGTTINSAQQKAMESATRISSGLRISTPSSDPAAVAIATKMQGNISGAHREAMNLQDRISNLQTRDGALGSISDQLQRLRELSVASNNGTLDATAKQALQTEADQIVAGIKDTATFSEFNTKKIATDVTPSELGIDGINLGSEGTLSAIDKAISAVASKRGDAGAEINRVDSQITELATRQENLTASYSRIAETDIAEESTAMSSASVQMEVGIKMLKAQQNLDATRVNMLLNGL